jgi:signal peptidase
MPNRRTTIIISLITFACATFVISFATGLVYYQTETGIVWPYAWLRLPLLVSGIVSMMLTVPVYFSEKLVKYVKTEVKKTEKPKKAPSPPSKGAGTRNAMAVLSTIGIVLLAVGFLFGFLATDNTMWGISNYPDSVVLSPSSEREIFTHDVSTPGTIVQVVATANSTLEIDLIRNDRLELRWSDTDFSRNYQLGNPGTWTAKMRNNSTVNFCNVTSTVELKTPNSEIDFPYLWLRTPFFFVGGLIFVATIMSLFISRFKTGISRKSATTIGIVVVFVLLLFSYQLCGLIMGTSNPWMVGEGVSMEPTIVTGDLVVFSGEASHKVVPGDIVLFREITIDESGQVGALSKPVMHRILYLTTNGTQTYIKTKGDNNPTPDDWLVPEQSILGKAVLIIPKVGFVMLLLDSLQVKIILIAAILFLTFAWPSVKSTLKKTSFSPKRNEKKSRK